MIYVINSLEFQETNVSFSLNTNKKPKSRKLDKTIPTSHSNFLRQIKLMVAVCMEITYHFIHRPRG